MDRKDGVQVSAGGSEGAAEAPVAGLSGIEAGARLAQYGPNRLPEPKLAGPWLLFLRQFQSPFIYILVAAAVVSLLVQQVPSAVFIVIVLLLNAAIGTVQEYSAQKSAAGLRSMVHGNAHVIREGEAQTVDVEQVVPGDLVLLASGDRVPADIALTDSDALTIDESMLTGESLAVSKDHRAQVAADAPLGDRSDTAFAGSIVTGGRGRGVVTATALRTEIGRIAAHITQERVSEPPLMIRIRRFTYQVAFAIFGGIVLLIALMALRGGYDGREMVMMAIGLAVSAIPEGLPAALTVALAMGMRRMVARNVIIRKLIAVEALGSCTFICSDKTGTLTVNKLTIHSIHLPGGDVIKVTGAGIGPGAVDGELEGPRRERVRELCVAGVLANESQLSYAGRDWRAEGDIVDIAFLVLGKKLGLSLQSERERHRQRKLIPYESERAFSASLNDEGDAATLYAKGSPEKILAASTTMLTREGVRPVDRAAIEAQFDALARGGYRVIALARKHGLDPDGGDAVLEQDAPLQELTFLGLAAMIDPVRPEAREAIAKCRAGGIDVAMVTGDHPATARAIGADLGICTARSPVVTGTMIRAAEQQGSSALQDLVRSARVFARIEPVQKQAIVQAFMDEGHFVAVTGDGVNDAPAMRQANAGVAMGKSGTDVAKEAADLIVVDDNFASIVAGVEEGRLVYNNIRKVIGLLIATAFSALLLFFLSVLAGLPMPMTAVQLLWLNLVANGVQDVSLAFEGKEGGELEQPPRRPDEPIFERHIVEHVLVAGTAMGLLAYYVFSSALAGGASDGEARNLTLLIMVLFGNMHTLSSRSESRSVFAMPLFSNRFLAIAVPSALALHLVSMHIPGLNAVLQIAPVSLPQLGQLIGVAALFLAVEELHKATIRWRRRPARPA